MLTRKPLCLLPLLLILGCSPQHTLQNEASQVKDIGLPETSLGLDLNDVAILMPLNTVPELRTRLPKLLDKPTPELFGVTSDPYPGENFVPDWFVSQSSSEDSLRTSTTIPVIKRIDTVSQTALAENNLYTLVSLRLDPCTNNIQAVSEADCVRELRLVWQVLDEGESLPNERLSQRADANIHTLYTLTREEFKTIARSLKILHANASIDTKGLPLLPHPVIAQEGVESVYLKGVLAIVHTYARSSKLNEIAAMRISSNGDSWTFMHVAVENGEIKELAIPGSKTFAGDPNFISTVSEIGGGTSTMGTFPETLGHEFVMPSLSMGGRGSRPPTPDQAAALLTKKLNSRNMVENPSKHNPKNVDCVSCHITDKQDRDYELALSRNLLPENFPALESFTENRYTSHWNLERKFPNNTKSLTTSVQNFAFLGGDMGHPVIVQRVINDAAETLSFLEKNPDILRSGADPDQ